MNEPYFEARRDDDEAYFIEARRFRTEDIARIFDVEAHLVTYDLSPGYWEAALARRIRRRSIRVRFRRVAARIGRAFRKDG